MTTQNARQSRRDVEEKMTLLTAFCGRWLQDAPRAKEGTVRLAFVRLLREQKSTLPGWKNTGFVSKAAFKFAFALAWKNCRRTN